LHHTASPDHSCGLTGVVQAADRQQISVATPKASRSRRPCPSWLKLRHRCLALFCRAAQIDFALGVATTATLRGHVATLEASTAARHAASPGEGKRRRYKTFFDGARSWSRVERIIARVEPGPQSTDIHNRRSAVEPGAVELASRLAKGARGSANRQDVAPKKCRIPPTA
jgi:hypothetical protein